MIALALLATLADMASMRFETEANPIVLLLGAYCFPARLAATSFAFSAAALGGSRIRRVVLAWIVAVGAVGATSNVWGLPQL